MKKSQAMALSADILRRGSETGYTNDVLVPARDLLALEALMFPDARVELAAIEILNFQIDQNNQTSPMGA